MTRGGFMAVEFNRELLGMRGFLRLALALASELETQAASLRGQAEETLRAWADFAEAVGGEDQEAVDRAFEAGLTRAAALRQQVENIDAGYQRLRDEVEGPAGQALDRLLEGWEPKEPPAPPWAGGRE